MKRTRTLDLGELAWPGKYDEAFYQTQHDTDEFAFACLYEGEPMSEKLSLCPKHCWKMVDTLPKIKWFVLAVDTHSGKVTDKGDPAAIIALGRSVEGPAVVLGYEQGRWDPYQLFNTVGTLYGLIGRLIGACNNDEIRGVGRQIAIEDANLGTWLFNELGMQNQRDPTIAMPGSLQRPEGSKKVRARPVATQIRNGHIQLWKELPHAELIKQQWFTLGFPGVHDEAVDTLALAYNTLVAEEKLIGHPMRYPLLPLGKGSQPDYEVRLPSPPKAFFELDGDTKEDSGFPIW